MPIVYIKGRNIVLPIVLTSCLENDLCCQVEPFIKALPFIEVAGEAPTKVTLMKLLILKGRHQYKKLEH